MSFCSNADDWWLSLPIHDMIHRLLFIHSVSHALCSPMNVRRANSIEEDLPWSSPQVPQLCESTPAALLAGFNCLTLWHAVRVHSHFTELCRVALSVRRSLCVRLLLLPLPLSPNKCSEMQDTLGSTDMFDFTDSVFAWNLNKSTPKAAGSRR